jgi:hypothetical protein
MFFNCFFKYVCVYLCVGLGESSSSNDALKSVVQPNAGLIDRKHRVDSYFKSFKKFVAKHSNDSVSALPSKRWSAYRRLPTISVRL